MFSSPFPTFILSIRQAICQGIPITNTRKRKKQHNKKHKKQKKEKEPNDSFSIY